MTLQVVGLFCEDIREEKSGQFTLVGILPDNVNVPAPPDPQNKDSKAVIPRLGLYIRVHLGFKDDPGPMTLKLILPDLSEIELGTINTELIENSKTQALANDLPFAGILQHALLQGFTIPGAGKVVAVLDSKGERHTCAVLNFIIEEKKL
jgi:hypothetical protein